MFDGIDKGGALRKFPSAPGSAERGLTQSPLFARMAGSPDTDIPGFSMQQPGIAGLMQQQAQWAQDRKESRTPQQQNRLDAFRALASQPAPTIAAPPAQFSGASSQKSLSEVLAEIAEFSAQPRRKF